MLLEVTGSVKSGSLFLQISFDRCKPPAASVCKQRQPVDNGKVIDICVHRWQL